MAVSTNSSTNKYVVRQPIKDLQGKTIAYEIRFSGEGGAYESGESGGQQDFAAADTIYNFLTQNTDRTLKGAVNFMTFTTNLLMKQTPKLFNPADLVIQVDDSVIIHPLAMRFVERYSKEGYKVAVNEFQFSPRYFSILDRFDYIKINFRTTNDTSIRNIVEMAHSMGKRCIATEVNDEELYQKAFIMEVDAMEGRYVAEQMFTSVHSSTYLQSNFFRLMVAITKDEPDVEEIEQIISMDATLTYSLLKIVNSAYFALNDAYLMGMFSTLNYLIAAPLDEILAEIPITQEVKDALLLHEGRCGKLYDLVLSYERADWAAIGDLAGELGIPVNLLTNSYFQCLEEVNGIWGQLMSTSAAAEKS